MKKREIEAKEREKNAPKNPKKRNRKIINCLKI
jgi:hypothetical protein